MNDVACPVTARFEGDTNRSPGRQRWEARPVEQTVRRLLDADARAFLHHSLSTPCLDVVERAAGSILHCASSGELLDFHGNNAHPVGHAHPAVVSAVKAQLDDLTFSPRRFTKRAAITLAQRLIDLAPSPLDKILFAPGGAEAISMALKLARLATGKCKTVSFWDSFHGATLDTISVGGERLFRDGMAPLMPGALHVPLPVVPQSHRDLLPMVRCYSRRMLERLQEIGNRHAGIGSVSAVGLQLAIELVDAAGRPDPERADRVLYRCLESGLSFKVADGNVLSLAPPLTVSWSELERAAVIFDNALSDEPLTKMES